MRPVVDRLDHQMINDLEPFTTLNPSAENLPRYFYDQTKQQLHEMTEGRVIDQGLHSLRDRHQLRPLLRISPICMYLIELYKSVQGESSFAGLPCIFVRLAGCNLRCAWCDSEYTFTGGKPFTLEEIEEQIKGLTPCTLVEFTGGEPMLQAKELLPLMQRLLDQDFTLMIETSGERPLDDVPKAVHKIVDVKCPGAGSAADAFRLENLASITRNDEVKFVISNREDYEFAANFIREHSLDQKAGQILLSPAFQNIPKPQRTADNMALDRRKLVEWMLADMLPARLSLQIHKFIWEPMKKGVRYPPLA